ncbi:MAG: GIY-YIG nuclease family protein [Patescibacteria group bacterium]|nr:GIY-YIG nuclease family protein [Patescibacteria group bacterium]
MRSDFVQGVEPSFDELRIEMYSLYILNCDKAFFYSGITDDVSKRLVEHRCGYSPHTRRYKSIELVYTEEFPTKHLSELREKQIKGWTREKKKALIEGNLEKLRRLSKSRS